MTRQDKPSELLPACVTEYIDEVIRRMRYSRSARREVRQELTDHFTDALADCADPQERQKLAESSLPSSAIRRCWRRCCVAPRNAIGRRLVKALIRTGQGFLLLLVLFGLYTAWFMTGRPTISTNYVAVLSEKTAAQGP